MRTKYQCPTCGTRSSHEALQTGKAERVLLAVEETKPRTHRWIRTATLSDRDLITKARQQGRRYLNSRHDRELESDRRDRRPISLGFARTSDMFTERQWLLFNAAFDWFEERSVDGDVRTVLKSTALQVLSPEITCCAATRATMVASRRCSVLEVTPCQRSQWN